MVGFSNLHPLIPLALTSLALSLTVCAAAGTQATLPNGKVHGWSRPLVALLYFLQPIIRGWARYQGRLLLRPAPLAAQQTLDSVALRSSRQPLGQADYWSQQPLDRFSVVGEILRRLDQQGWPNRADIGWCDYDVEIYGSRWTNLQLTTVVEAHGPGKHLLRCRLRPRWSLQAKVVFCSVFGLEVLALGLMAAAAPLLWLLLLSLPLFVWLLRREHRTLQSMMVILLDEIGQQWKLTRVRPAFGAPHGGVAAVGEPRKTQSPASLEPAVTAGHDRSAGENRA